MQYEYSYQVPFEGIKFKDHHRHSFSVVVVVVVFFGLPHRMNATMTASFGASSEEEETLEREKTSSSPMVGFRVG